MPACYVIFGAKLRPDGRAGPALARRVAGALMAAQGRPEAVFLVTGGQPRCGVSEAAVMRDLLVLAGIAPTRILIEDRARNTRDSAVRCAAILRESPALAPVLVCSDRFHQPRCVWLLRLAGIRAAAAPTPTVSTAALNWLREGPALVYDTLAMLLAPRR